MFPLYPGELRGPADKNVCEAQREVGRRPSNLASCKNPAGYLARGKWAASWDDGADAGEKCNRRECNWWLSQISNHLIVETTIGWINADRCSGAAAGEAGGKPYCRWQTLDGQQGTVSPEVSRSCQGRHWQPVWALALLSHTSHSLSLSELFAPYSLWLRQVARLSGDCSCRQPSTAEARPRVAEVGARTTQSLRLQSDRPTRPPRHWQLTKTGQSGSDWSHVGVNTIHDPQPSPHLHLALTCWLHSPLQEAEAARLRQWWALAVRSGGSLCTAVGRDRDTQEAWTVHSMVGTRPTRPGQPVQQRAGEPKPAQPVARWRQWWDGFTV